MAVAIAWLPGPAGTRRRVAKPSVEEPDAAEPARPDLWGARVSNDPGLPDRTLPADAREIGALDAAAITEVAGEAWPIVRSPDELHDALVTLSVLPPTTSWAAWYEELERARRATTMVVTGRQLWVPTERSRVAQVLYPDGQLTLPVPELEQDVPESQEGAATEVIRGWLESSGPQTARGLAETLVRPTPVIDAALARLEGEGQILRGYFSPGNRSDDGVVEWCNRRVLARIHRLTIGRLRREIEPVSAADFVCFLASWQHIAPGTQLHGTGGLLQVVRQLQGYEISAAAWEAQVLGRRVANYDREMLDHLCFSGDVMWGRLSPHPAFEADTATGTSRSPRKVRPTRVAPVTIFLREDAAWLIPTAADADARSPALSHDGRAVLEQLQARGASFLRDLVRATGRLPSEVEDGLWELVAGGIVTADGFDNLRALIDPKRRRGQGRFRAARPRHSSGRWALLREIATVAEVDEDSGPARTEAYARQLLLRWGVVFRDIIARETLVPPWRELLSALRRLESRGEIRGGRFVAGFAGEQFARPEAVESLRTVRRTADRASDDGSLRVAAGDPLNLLGIITPGSRVSGLSGDSVEVLGPVPASVKDAACGAVGSTSDDHRPSPVDC